MGYKPTQTPDIKEETSFSISYEFKYSPLFIVWQGYKYNKSYWSNMATPKNMEMSAFWSTQTIRPSWLFQTKFPNSNGLNKLNDHMVLSVRLPNINTTEEKYLRASKLYPEIFMTFDFTNGIDFEITFVENLNNDVEKVRWNYYTKLISQTKIEGGIFYAPPLTNARYVDNGEGIIVDILDDTGDVTMRYLFRKCILTGVAPSTYDYSSSEKITQNFSFKAMEVEVWFDDKNIKAELG